MRAPWGVNDRITYDVAGPVVRIGLNRSEKKNAFDLVMLHQLAEAYTRYEDDPALWCAILFAHGTDFTAGLDLAEVGPHVADEGELFPTGLVDPVGLGDRRRSKPVIIACRGWCLTIGTELALASDIVVAADDTKFGQIEVKRGIAPFGGATIRLPRVAGWHNAMRYLLTGDIFDAAEGYRFGLVQKITPPDAVLEAASEMAASVAAQAPLAVQASLQSAQASMLEGLEVETGRLTHRARALMKTEDAAEGLRSFLERRQGKFKGR